MNLFKKVRSGLGSPGGFLKDKLSGTRLFRRAARPPSMKATEWGKVRVYDRGALQKRLAGSGFRRIGAPAYKLERHFLAGMKLCLLFAAAFCAGRLSASFVHRNDPTAIQVSADGNWGLSFQQEGRPPVANASFDELRQYDAYYAENTQDKVLYLTFDAGFENGNTPAILDALKKHNAPATFFVVGNYIETSPDLVKRMIAEGHTVGNHTYHHPDMSKISTKEAFSKELTDLETLYQQTTGQPMTKFYRPPQGKYSEVNLKMAQEMGYKTFFWSLAYVDWYQDKQPTREEAFKKLLGRIHPGAVVLLHSTSGTNAQILDELLTKWEEMGYSFKSLDQLAGQ